VRMERKDGQVEIAPAGDIVSSGADQLRVELKKLLNEGTTQLTINMAEVTVIDSIGLGLVISLHNSLEKMGGKLSVINLSRDIYDLFRSMRLDHHFTVVGI
jgi:anti-anti-sigma factor